MGIRAKTVVVGREKHPERWPLERAKLINKHTEAIKTERANSIRQRRIGYEAGSSDMLQRLADQSDMMDYFFRAAGEALGRMAGKYLHDEIEKYDPVFREKQRMADAQLSIANLSVAFDPYPTADASEVIISRATLPPQQFHFATRVPMSPRRHPPHG